MRLGVIGCGRVTEERHLPALRSIVGARVVAVAEVDSGRLERVADQFRISGRYGDFRALLDDPAIDAVAVCVPAQFHVAIAEAALAAGKHLFIEKPLALDLVECDRLVEQAAQSSRKVMVGFNLRWHRLVRQARDVIDRGALGPLDLVRTALTSYHETVPDWRSRRERGGGVLVEMAVHHFDLWRFLLRSDVEEVFATSRSGQWDDETAVITARMANGVLAAVALSERTGNSNEVDVYGQGGRLHVDCYRSDGLEVLPRLTSPGDLGIRFRRAARGLGRLPRAVWGLRQGGDYVASYRSEWRHFIDAIERDTPVECTLQDGRSALQVMLAVAESASRGRPVTVAQAPSRLTPVG